LPVFILQGKWPLFSEGLWYTNVSPIRSLSGPKFLLVLSLPEPSHISPISHEEERIPLFDPQHFLLEWNTFSIFENSMLTSFEGFLAAARDI
jgi:hypothetical protein